LLLATGRYTIRDSTNIFENTIHIIEFDTPEYLISILREYIPPDLTVGIHCTLEDFYRIQKPLKDNFMNRFLYTRKFVLDVANSEDRALTIEETHCRAHRGLDLILDKLTYKIKRMYKKF